MEPLTGEELILVVSARAARNDPAGGAGDLEGLIAGVALERLQPETDATLDLLARERLQARARAIVAMAGAGHTP